MDNQLFAFVRQTIGEFCYQNLKDATGDIIEIGSNHDLFKKLATKCDSYVRTNIDKEGEEFLDITAELDAVKQYDGLVLAEVLEHVYDYRKALKNCYKLMKPGAFMIYTGPFYLEKHWGPEDFWRFSADAIERIMQEDGEIDIIKLKEITYGGDYQVTNVLMYGIKKS